MQLRRAAAVSAALLVLPGAALASGPERPDPGLRGPVLGDVALRKAPSTSDVEAAIRECANSRRRKRGLPALKRAKPLGQAARLHARNMRKKRFFDHTDPEGRGPGDRVAMFDTKRSWGVGENIAAGYSSAKSACSAWMKSSGHRANILNPDYTHVGGGYSAKGSARYYVQVFGFLRDQPQGGSY
jgi:uncharacterized protein YkwD